ncbi:restriction endonuclease [Geoglobus acetivorans]|uniref:Restriction endonuclease type IV Mrr domain-containing protein n=1 Tax=Geoglobus acetivorans TaxID=565033 RepID=A0A0A7GE59_GEOAI|nr:hypothetical protein GACE_0194 [Geoglobus acetivorans]
MPKCRKGKVVENRIGKRYEKAGYKVQYRKRTPEGEIDLIAKRKREKIAGEVKHSAKGRTVSSSEVAKIARKARRIKAKPTLILTGKTKLSSNAKKAAKKHGVRVKRL